MANAAKSPTKATSRMVVLLRSADRRKLDKLAAEERVSAGEIIRRSLASYKSMEARIRNEEEEKMMEGALKLLVTSLSGANESVRKTNEKLDSLHLELKKLDLR